jgi:hypothetical protein
MARRSLTLIALLPLLLSGSALAMQSSPTCALGASDRAWLDRSMRAWDYASTHISGIGHVKKIEAVIFDKDCVVTSRTAMNGGPNAWTGRVHSGRVPLPDGGKLPVGVISFAGSYPGGTFFVMSAPSVWRAAAKNGKGTTLENLMTAVMLHEATHVAQQPTYGVEIDEIARANHLPDDFNDDSIQKQFKDNPEFAGSVEREAKLLYDASQAKSRAEAAGLVRSALALIQARQARWYTGKDAYLGRVDDLFLTLEGSGQWLAYRWEIDPRGGNIPAADILPGLMNDHWWSQREGFAAFMALERLTGAQWKRQAFHDGRKTILQMLEEAARPRR